MTRRSSILIIAAILVAVAGYVAAGPRLAISGIKTAIVEHDSEQLADHIDFPVLRQNLKDQFNAFMAEKMAEELSDNPFAGLAGAIGSRLVDTMVDAMVTPAGLARAMEGGQVMRDAPDEHADRTAARAKLFKNARFSYDSLSRCSVYLPTSHDRETRFVLERTGITWKLTNIIIPLDRFP